MISGTPEIDLRLPEIDSALPEVISARPEMVSGLRRNSLFSGEKMSNIGENHPADGEDFYRIRGFV
jgi:hypothetical protein